MPELHELRTDTPNWDTKQRCTCGYESPSKAEQWKHQADALRPAVVALQRFIEGMEAGCDVLRREKERLTTEVELLREDRDEWRTVAYEQAERD